MTVHRLLHAGMLAGLLAGPCVALPALAADLPSQPFVSTGGKAQAWLPPDIGELNFETGAQHGDAATAAATLEALSAAIGALLAEHGVAPADIDSAELTKKTVALSTPAPDGATNAYTLGRHFRVQVRDLARWPDLVAALLAREHVDSLGVSFDRTDSEQVNRDLMTQAAGDARSNGALLAQAFGRQLGPAIAIARGPLDKIAPALLAGGGDGRPALPRPPATSSYAVPSAIPFGQSVTAVFRLK